MTDLRHADLWIAGRAEPAEARETFPVLDPGTGEVIGHAARGRAADVDLAVQAADRALRAPEWRGMTPVERGRLMWSLARRIEAEQESLARLLSLENGKPLSQARDEAYTTIRNFEYYAGWTDKIHGRVVPVGVEVFDYILHEPLGVVAHIIPWNYPLDIFARGVAPCLAVGNTVVVKPAEETPFGAVELARLATEVGFPPGVIYADPNLTEPPADLMKRGGADYSTVATQLLNAHYNDLGETHIVNTRQGGAVVGWPPDWVLEMPCRVDRAGVEPLPADPLPPACFGLLAQVKMYELLTVAAAVHGDREAACQALLVHPLGPPADQVQAVLDDLLVTHRAHLPQFWN